MYLGPRDGHAPRRGDKVADVEAPTREGAEDEEMDHHNHTLVLQLVKAS